MDHRRQARNGLVALAVVALAAPAAQAEPADRFDGSWAGRVRQSSGMQQCMPRIKFRVTISGASAVGEADATGRRLLFSGTIDADGMLEGTVTGWETIEVHGRHAEGEIRGTWTHRVCGWEFALSREPT